MREWLSGLFGRKQQATAVEDKRLLKLERDAQSLRLEMEECDRIVESLKKELERQRSNESARIAEAAQAQIEQLLSEIAAPVSQLLTQAYLLEVEGKPVQAKDVLAVAKRLVRALEDNGLKVEGRVGERAPFDPEYHEPLSSDLSPKPGQPVAVRFVGFSYRGKNIRKANVEGVSD